MKVRLIVELSGARNGQPWPGRGEVVDLPADEAQELVVSRIAEPVAEEPQPETATVADASEKRAPRKPKGE